MFDQTFELPPPEALRVVFVEPHELDVGAPLEDLQGAKALAILDVDGTLTAGSCLCGDRYLPMAGCWTQLHVATGTFDDPSPTIDGAETLLLRFLTTPRHLGGAGLDPEALLARMPDSSNRGGDPAFLRDSPPLSYEDFCRGDLALFMAADLRRHRALEVLRRIPRFPGARDLVGRLRDRGYGVVLVSGGLGLHVREVGRELGVAHTVANDLVFDEAGRLTGEVRIQVPWTSRVANQGRLTGKALVVDELSRRTGLSVEIAVGDSPGDFGAFALARRPLLVPDVSRPPAMRQAMHHATARRARRELRRPVHTVQNLEEIHRDHVHAPLRLEDLMDRRFLLITGKGGVGKSTVAATLALLAARRNKRVLVAELDTKERIPGLFGHPDVGPEVTRIYESIYSVNISPEEGIKEYGLMKLRLKTLNRLVFDNPMVKQFLDFLPGMRELVMIGKAFNHEREVDPLTGAPVWDMIIVDGPASGHGVPLFRLPQVILDAVPFGPLAAEAREIRRLLTDARRTALNLVALAEEMPVNETIELYRSIAEQVNLPMGALFINGVRPPLFDDPHLEARLEGLLERHQRACPSTWAEAALSVGRFRLRRQALEASYLARLEREVPLRPVHLPLLNRARLDFDDIAELGKILEEGLA